MHPEIKIDNPNHARSWMLTTDSLNPSRKDLRLSTKFFFVKTKTTLSPIQRQNILNAIYILVKKDIVAIKKMEGVLVSPLGMNIQSTYTLWLLELSSFSSSLGMSSVDNWILEDFEFILFHSFSTRKKIHWKRRSISRAVIAKTVM